MFELQVTPFVPGIARGILCRGIIESRDSILIVTHGELKIFESRPAGFVVVDGAPFSHPMIRLFGLGIPTVMVSAAAAMKLEEGREVIVDGARGSIIWPAASYTFPEDTTEVPVVSEAPATADSVQIALRASASGDETVVHAVEKGASAIGLVGSEFLIPEDGRLPDTAFYKNVLGRLCNIAWSLPVTVRLLDLAVDKPPPWLEPVAGMMGTLGPAGPTTI